MSSRDIKDYSDEDREVLRKIEKEMNKEKAGEMDLVDFVSSEKTYLERFTTWYAKLSAENPEAFPVRASKPNWDNIMRLFRNTRIG